MYADFINEIHSADFTSEKVNQKLGQALDHLINSKEKSIVQIAVQKQCEILTAPYVALMQYYANSKHDENYEQVVSNFLKHYEKFTDVFTRLIKITVHKKYFCNLIALSWLEILEEMEKEAYTKKDMLVRSINMQLQHDITHIIENVLQFNQKTISSWKNKSKK
jgi:deoxyhypusine synthase